MILPHNIFRKNTCITNLSIQNTEQQVEANWWRDRKEVLKLGRETRNWELEKACRSKT